MDATGGEGEWATRLAAARHEPERIELWEELLVLAARQGRVPEALEALAAGVGRLPGEDPAADLPDEPVQELMAALWRHAGSLGDPRFRLPGPVENLVASPDGSLFLVLVAGRGVEMVRGSDGRRIASWELPVRSEASPEQATHLAFGPDGGARVLGLRWDGAGGEKGRVEGRILPGEHGARALMVDLPEGYRVADIEESGARVLLVGEADPAQLLDLEELWEAEPRQGALPRRVLTGPTGRALRGRMSPEGNRVALQTDRGLFQVDLASGRTLQLRHSFDEVVGLEYSPSGRWLSAKREGENQVFDEDVPIGGSRDIPARVEVFDAATGKKCLERTLQSWISGASWTEGEKLHVDAVLLDPETGGAEEAGASLEWFPSWKPPRGPEGSRVQWRGCRILLVEGTRERERLRWGPRLDLEEARELQVAGSGRRLLVSGREGPTSVFDLETGRCLRAVRPREGHGIRLSRDGRHLLRIGPGDVEVLDVDSGEPVPLPELRTSRTRPPSGRSWESGDLLDEGRRLVLASTEEAVLFDLESGERLWTGDPEYRHEVRVRALPSGRGFAFWCEDGSRISLHDGGDGREVGEVIGRNPWGTPARTSHVAFHPREDRILFRAGETAFLAEIAEAVEVSTLTLERSPHGWAVLPAGRGRILVAESPLRYGWQEDDPPPREVEVRLLEETPGGEGLEPVESLTMPASGFSTLTLAPEGDAVLAWVDGWVRRIPFGE